MSQEKILIVFGQGPVVDQSTRNKVGDETAPPGHEDLNYLGKLNVLAAVTLCELDPRYTRIVMSGGHTGNNQQKHPNVDYATEARLMARFFKEAGGDEELLVAEDRSRDTIENIVYTLNLLDKRLGPAPAQHYDILCASFHVVRTQALMTLLAAPVDTAFDATEVLHNLISPDECATTTNQRLLTALDSIDDLKNPDRFSGSKNGTEHRSLKDRYTKDDIFLREALERPEKWLRVVAEFTQESRIRAVLTRFEILWPNRLREAFHISPVEDMARIRSKLRRLPQHPLTPAQIEQWEREDASVVSGAELALLEKLDRLSESDRS